MRVDGILFLILETPRVRKPIGADDLHESDELTSRHCMCKNEAQVGGVFKRGISAHETCSVDRIRPTRALIEIIYCSWQPKFTWTEAQLLGVI